MKTDAARDVDARPHFTRAIVSALVEMPSLNGQTILYPKPFYMDQRALSLAEQPMLQCGDRHELILGIHRLRPVDPALN